MLASPGEAVEYLKEDQRALAVYTRSTIRLGDEARIEEVPLTNFQLSYFGKSETYLDRDFMTRWREKSKVSAHASLTAILAEEEVRAGGTSIFPLLENWF